MADLISPERKGGMTPEQIHTEENALRVMRGEVPDGPRDFGPKERDWTPETHQVSFSDSQAAIVRSDFVRLFGAGSQQVADFDRSIRRDGMSVALPPDPATRAAFDEAGLSYHPQASDYSPDVGGLRRTVSDDQHRGEVIGTISETCADWGMDRVIGTAFIEAAVAVGNEVRGLSSDAYDVWKSRQNSMLVRIAGNVAEAAAMHQRAISVLGRAKSERARAFAKDFKDGRGFASAQLISLLNTHALQLELLKKAQTE